MIGFQKVHLRNFMPFAEEELDLTLGGPTLVTGLNLDKGFADSNGAGKSSLLESVVWCLFNETLRGLASRDVVRRGSTSGCEVMVRFTKDGTPCTVTRYQDDPRMGNRLVVEVDGEEVKLKDKLETQRYVENLLGVDFRLFAQCVVIGQDSPVFAGSTDAEKKRILERVTGIGEFEEYVTCAKDRIGELQQERAKHEATLTRLNVEEGRVKDDTRIASQSEVEFSKTLEGELTSLRTQREEVLEKTKCADDLSTSLGFVSSQLRELCNPKVVFAKGKVLEDLKREVDAATRLEVEVKGRKEALWDTVLDQQRELHSIREACPTCKRPFDSESVLSARKVLEEKLRDTTQKHLTLIAELGRLTKDTQEKNQRLDLLMRESNDLECRVRDLERKCATLEAQLACVRSSQATLAQLDQRIEGTTKRVNPWTSQLDRLDKRLTELRQEQVREGDHLDRISKDTQYVNFWVTGFGKKGIQSYLLDDVAGFLNSRAAEYSQFLTDGGIEVVFSTQKKLTDGRVVEDFNVQAYNKQGAEVYKGNSVGERQRVDFCVSLALQDLIRSRTGAGVSLFICDEATANVDGEGSERVVSLLTELTRRGRSVWFVTHSAKMQDLFPSKVRVVNEGGVARIERGGDKIGEPHSLAEQAGTTF
jgi:DNA repair exonuclease SbcCD ATPase subunit